MLCIERQVSPLAARADICNNAFSCRTWVMRNEHHDYMTEQEVADLLRRPTSTIRRWRKEGNTAFCSVPAFSVGGRRLYKRADVLAWLDSQREA